MISDPLTPALSEFVITAEEELAIDHALKLHDSWNLDQKDMAPVRQVLKDLRERIKEFHLLRQNHTCCYCRTNLFGGGFFMVDREHIIPKSHCKKLTYVMENLSVACKRCNMEIKKDKTSLFVDPSTIESTYQDKSTYHVIHPNFEVYEDFITRRQAQHGKANLVKFIIETPGNKTNFMFNFFKLNELEVNSMNDAQGVAPLSSSQQFMLDALRAQIQNQPALVQEILKLVIEEQSSKASLPMVAKGIDSTDSLNYPIGSLADTGDKWLAPKWSLRSSRSDKILAIGHDVVLALPPPDSSDDNEQP